MEKQTEQEQNLNIQQKHIADLDNKSILGSFFNCFKLIKFIIPEFNIHTDQSKINLSNPAGGQSLNVFQQVEIQTKLDENISPRMEVMETILLLSENKITNQTGKPAKYEQANDVVEQKVPFILNPRLDIAGLVGPNDTKTSESYLMQPVSPDFMDSTNSCAEMPSIGSTSKCHIINLTETAVISNGLNSTLAVGNKKVLNFTDVNPLKFATLLQSMMVDVLNLSQNVNNSDVLIEGFSVKVSVDIRKRKQETIDSTELNDEIGNISKPLAIQFTEELPAMAHKQELETVMATCVEKLPQDEILRNDQLFDIDEKEEEVSNLADEVCSDDTLTLENIISVVDLTCYNELNNQELKTTSTINIEEQIQDEILHGDQLLAINKEEISSMANKVCSNAKLFQEVIFYDNKLRAVDEGELSNSADRVFSDDTLTLENGISVFRLTCNNEFNKLELKAIDATSVEELPQDELHNGDKLPVEKEEMSSMADGVSSNDTHTVENRISVFDLTCNDEFNIVTASIEELPLNEILHDDELVDVNKEEEMLSMADGMCSNKISIVENGVLIQDLPCNELPCDVEKEVSIIILKKVVTRDLNNELKEMKTTPLSKELMEIVNNELTQMTTIERNNELPEIKSKDEVKECSAISLSYKRDSTIDVSEPRPPEHNILELNLSVSKYCTVTEDLLTILNILNDASVNGSLKSPVAVPAFYFRSWYFQNIRQGFLLNIMLRKANVSTLNYMRNLYFVIITTDSQSISIAINFALQNEIFLHFKEPPIYFTGDCCKYTVSAKEVLQIYSPVTGIVESCTTYEESMYHSNNTNGQSRSDLPSSCSTLMAEPINAATSYLYFDWFDDLQSVDVAVGQSKFELHPDISKFKLPGMDKPHGKTWLTDLLRVPKNEMGTFFIHDVNETVFEQFSVDRYMEAAFGKAISSNLFAASNSNFYNIFFKCLGHTIACTMLSFFISML